MHFSFNGIFSFINILLSTALNFDNYVGYKDFTYCGYSKKYAHLSFDDGPNKNLNGTDTLKILDVLDELNIKSSFFLIGKNINMYPYVSQEIVKRGHTVGSHSWSHRDITNLEIKDAINEFSQSSLLFEKILGLTPKYYRPPYGNINQNLINEINYKTKMNLVMWNMDLNDWRIVQDKNSKMWARNQLDYIKKVISSSSKFNHAPPSMILLAHDIRSTQDMIKNVVNYIKSLGYIFVDLDTCYENWLIDKKPESPCVNSFSNIKNGIMNVEEKCIQLASGLPLSCIPNGNICLSNSCGSPGCELNCDNRNLCNNGKLTCKPNCKNKNCGDDGCGNSCGMCGTDCINGMCLKPNVPDISKIKLCRPIENGKLELKPIKDNSILLNYTITSQWDTGMVIIYTVTNNYKDIEKFILRVYTDSFLAVYGADIYNKIPGYWIEIDLKYIKHKAQSKFTIEFKVKSSDPMIMCCAPSNFEISCLEIDKICNNFISNANYLTNSYNIFFIFLYILYAIF